MSELIFVPVSVTPVSTRTPTQSDLAWPDLTGSSKVQNLPPSEWAGARDKQACQQLRIPSSGREWFALGQDIPDL